MSTLTERTTIQSIKVLPTAGRIEVERVAEVLRDGEVIAAGTPTIQKLMPDQDLTSLQLEPLVMAIAAAAWTPELTAAATEERFARLAEHHAGLQSEHDQRLANLQRSLAAVAAAHKELDVEHATLAERSEQVTRARSDLFDRHEQIRRQHPQLDAMLTELAAKAQ